MFTYAVYNFILFGATWAAYLYEKSESKNAQIVFYSVAFLIPFVFLAIRYDIGTDYQNYVEYFYRISHGDIIPKEPGYILVNYLISEFHLNVQWLFVFFGFWFIFFGYKTLPRDGFSLGIFLFISTMYLYEGFSAIRQGLAIVIMMYALKYVYEKRFWVYLFWAVIAMMFHLITAVLLLIIYPIINKRINKYVTIFLVISFFILIQFTNIAKLLLSLVGNLAPQYAWYVNSAFAEEARTSNGLLGPIIKISIAILILFFKDKIIEKYQYANIVLNMYLFYTISYIFHLKISIFGRVEHVFIFSMVLSIVYFLKTFEVKGRVIIMYIILLFYYLMFMRYIVNGTLSVDNDVYVNPYQTVLFDKVGER